MPTKQSSVSEQVVVDVLVVEDDEETRTGMVELLDSEELAVGWAANGAEVFRLVDAGVRPRLLLLDMQMPVMDGWTFLKERRNHSVLGAVPVLLTSGLDRLQVVPGEVVAFLSKPVAPEALLEVVRQYAHPQPIVRAVPGGHDYYLHALSEAR